MSLLPLYLAQRIAELNKLVEKGTTVQKLDVLCRVSDTLYRKAIQVKDSDPLDEELLFVFCLRYLKLLETIKMNVKDEKFYNMRFSKNISIITSLKELTEKSLLQRYQHLELPIKTKEENIADIVEEINVNKILNSALKFVPDNEIFISVTAFYEMMNDASLQLLVIDSRSADDYKESCIKFKNIMNVPDEVIRKGLSTNTLQHQLSPENASIFKKRHQFDIILLIDGDTSHISYPLSKLEVLRKILVDWDLEEKYNTPPVVLNGGIKAFADNYPTLVTNPSKVYNKFYGALDDLMGEIEYPELHSFEADPERPVTPVEDSVCEDSPATPPGKDDFPSTVLLHSILTLSEHQLVIESRLLDFAKRKMLLKEQLGIDNQKDELIINEIKDISSEVSKNESFRIELDERRNILNAEYSGVKTDDDEDLLSEMLADIKTLDKKRLQKYQNRKNIEMKDAEMKTSPEKPKVPEKSANPEAAKSSPPKVDRNKKPAENPLIKQLLYLQECFQDTGVTGLINIRNTCYLNSLIQCLRFIPQIAFHFLTNHYGRIRNDVPMTVHFADLIKIMWTENKVALRPNNFYAEVCRLDNYEKGYANGCHEDVHEFYIFVLKHLHNEIRTPFVFEGDECTAKLKDWLKTFDNYISFINKTFYYQAELTTCCTGCTKTVVKFDYGNTVFINLPSTGKAIQLDEKLKEWMVDASGQQSKYCSNCENTTYLKKRISYYPTVLAINIVRYDFSKAEGCILRRNNECCFQDEIYFGKYRYVLSSVSLHSGNRDFGHYTALCINPINDRWIESNDDVTNYVTPSDAKYRVKCYMLFYALTSNPDEVNKHFFQGR